MNSLDREAFEFIPQSEAFEGETEWGGEAEWGNDAEWGGEAEWGHEGEYEGEWRHEGEFGETEVLGEAEVMELANELLGVSNEAELDLFLGSLIKRVGSAAGKIIKSPVGQALGGILKGAVKKALPLAGTALGAFVGGPLGAQIGGGLANAAGSALGLEAEAMNSEDREFEGAKTFVQMAGDAVSKTLAAHPDADPVATARAAVMAAARRHAPGLLGSEAGVPGTRHHRSGRWVRHGRNIIILNCRA
jgi:hypothetical protein